MKYFNIPALTRTIHRIFEDSVTQEHRTGTVALGLARNYFPVFSFAITLEQIQPIINKRPDLTLIKYRVISVDYSIHTIIEVKSLVNSNMSNIVEQLFTTVVRATDYFRNITNNYSAFMIGIKGTKIAFYVYHTFGSLEYYDIPYYNGFIPLTYLIPDYKLTDINKGPLLGIAYRSRVDFYTDFHTLRALDVQETQGIVHPLIFDLLNPQHQESIHRIFRFLSASDPYLFIAD